MKLKIVTPEKLVFEREVASVTLPGKAGQLTVLDGHDLLVTGLAAGRLYFKFLGAEGRLERTGYDIGGGFAEIRQRETIVFVQRVTPSSDDAAH